jgi:hypothetical protein
MVYHPRSMTETVASIRCDILRSIPDFTIQYQDRDELWFSARYTIYRGSGDLNAIIKMFEIPAGPIQRTLGRSRLLSRVGRFGIRTLLKLKTGTILAVSDGKIFRIQDGNVEERHIFRYGIGPLRYGWCEDDRGHCFLGEYFLNKGAKRPVHVLCSPDDGRTWEIVHEFRTINHIHFLQWDPFTGYLWLGTGDKDEESEIAFSKDQGVTWIPIGKGDQAFRAVSLIFTQDYIYWGSDAPTRQNYLYRYSRTTHDITRLAAVDGPVHYSMALENGLMLFGTTVEGNSEGESGEWDRTVRLWASINGIQWTELLRWQKDNLHPYGFFGYGRILFPYGRYGHDVAYFTTQAVQGCDNICYQVRISPSQ